MTVVEFTPFPSIARLRKPCVVQEKIDGTNSAIGITDDLQIYAQSRNRFIDVKNDNHGFANWVDKYQKELIEQLGPGVHFGEWWGQGISQRKYGLIEKRFSLFNTNRWHSTNPEELDFRCIEAPLCHVVPVLATLEEFNTQDIDRVMDQLKDTGSHAAPGCMDPEGIVIFHTQNQALYKVTFEYDKGKWSKK